MKKIIFCLISLVFLCGCGCNSISLTEDEFNNLKNYVDFADTYIESDLAKNKAAARVMAEPYRARKRLIQDIFVEKNNK